MMRRGGPRERARSTRPLAPQTEAEAEDDLLAALAASLTLEERPLAGAAAAAARVASDDDWEVVPEPEAELDGGGAANPFRECATGEEAAAGLRDLRIYVVWVVRGDRTLAGVHCSAGGLAYENLARDGSDFGQIQWRRVRTLAAATEAYRTEAARHRVPARPRFYRWA